MAQNFLNLYDIFVNEVSGSELMFVILSLIAIAFICSKFRFPNSAMIMIMSVWLIFIGIFFGWLLAIVILYIGIFFGWMVIKLMTR